MARWLWRRRWPTADTPARVYLRRAHVPAEIRSVSPACDQCFTCNCEGASMKRGSHHSYQTKRRLSMRVRRFWTSDKRAKARDRSMRRFQTADHLKHGQDSK